jgi:spermidine synthase
MLDGGRTGLYYDVGEEVGRLRPDAQRVVMLGLGGGEMLRAVRRALPKAELVGVEHDERVIAWATRDFGVTEFGVKTVLADARAWLNLQPVGFADALLVDVFEDSVLPWRFSSVGFYAGIRRRLPRGLIVQNVWPAMRGASVGAVARAAGFNVEVRQLDEGNALLFMA